jgi:hypothetical protein
MGKANALTEVRKYVLDGEPFDIDDVSDRYELDSGETRAVQEYMSSVFSFEEERRNGFPKVYAFWERYRSKVNKCRLYMPIIGGLAGGVAGYLSGDAEEAAIGAGVGALLGEAVEFIFSPLARLMGVPPMSSVAGSLAYLNKVTMEAEKKLGCGYF